MNAQSTEKTSKVLKESKNKIKVDFDRMPFWKRFRLKYLSTGFLMKVVVWIFRFVLLLGISYIILYPFFTKIVASFMGREDFVDAMVKIIPKHPTLATYSAIIKETNYFRVLLNTTVLSASTALIQTFICSMIGYGFAKYKFKGQKIMFFFVILTMVIPPETLRLAMYMKVRNFDIFGIFKLLGGGVFEGFKVIPFTSLNIANTYIPFILFSLGGLAFKNGLYIFMMRQFFRGVPDELEESAFIDGSTTMKTFIRIVLPISIPMMITIFLFAFSWQWTDNFYTDIFFSTTSRSAPKLMPSIIGVPKSLDTDYAGGTMYSAAIKNTCGLLIIYPLVILYLFCQRYLVQGIERSGIVG